MTLREPAGRREQFFPPRVGPAPRKAGIPDRRFRIDENAEGRSQERPSVFSGWQPGFTGSAIELRPLRRDGTRPFAGRDARRGIRFGLGSDVPDTGLLLRPGAQCPDGFGHVTLFFKGFSSP